MKTKPREIVVPSDNPFLNDALDRRQHVESLCGLLDGIDESLILSVNGRWGSGKSSFLQMMKVTLEQKGYRTAFFNAWRSDYMDDPRPALISEITELIPSSEKVKKKLMEAGKNLLKVGIPAIVKALTVGLLDLKDVTEEAIATVTSEYAGRQISEYLQVKENIEEFKDELNNAVSHLRIEGHRIAVFIDELDRCRPVFALRVLEIAKHLFDIEGISFILGADEDQLRTSISSAYGLATDTAGYLRRFIDLTFDLPEPDLDRFFDHLLKTLEFEPYFEKRKKYRENQSDVGLFKLIFTGLAKLYVLSLRDIEKCFIRMSLIFLSTPENEMIYPVILSFLMILSLKDKPFYIITRYLLRHLRKL